MKKLLLIFTAFFTMLSCSVDEQITKNSKTIGVTTKTPDIKIPEDDGGWARYGIRPDGTYGQVETHIGLRIPNYTVAQYPGLTQDSYAVTTISDTLRLNYPCYLANVAPFLTSGQNDLVIDRVADGIPEEATGDYLMEGMLTITTFVPDGDGYYIPFGVVEKQSFWVSPNIYKMGFDDLLGVDYELQNPNYMWIWAQTADLYYNKAKVKLGKNLIVVEFNPDKFINESNYENNVATLPVTVLPQTINNWSATGVLNLSILTEKAVRPATDLTAIKVLTGRDKHIMLNWHCDYHASEEQPFYAKHWFTVKRNGTIIADNLEHSEYKDTEDVNGNFAPKNYEITITVPGLGTSTPITKVVTRR